MLVGRVFGKIKKVQRKKLPKTPPKVSFSNIHSLPIPELISKSLMICFLHVTVHYKHFHFH